MRDALWALLALAFCGAAHAQVPIAARPYQRMVLRESRLLYGMDAPTAVFAAQIHTESGWKSRVCSPYACGLAQFIPATAAQLAREYPATLGANAPFDPEWSIRALVRYDHDLRERVTAATPCDRWAFTLSAYNGGLGWIPRDRAMCRQVEGCDPSLWWGNVERFSRRSASNTLQNRAYPRLILLERQRLYRAWGGVVACR